MAVAAPEDPVDEAAAEALDRLWQETAGIRRATSAAAFHELLYRAGVIAREAHARA